jgi:hypothetical protein
MEGRVKSHISEKTYITNIETLEEEDANETSELYMIPISGHKIMVAPGKTIMEDGIAHCYVYVIKNEKVLCKLGVYEKKTETMPLFFDISTFPEGSFCLFEEFEKNPTKLLDFEMIETDAEPGTNAVETKRQNVFDFLIDEFAKIPNKKERLKSAYKSLFSTYETKKSVEKYKKFKPILKIISEAGKEAEPTDAFIQTLKTNSQDKPVFVMTLLALQRVFLIEFTFITQYEMADEDDEYIKMKEDWPISNATKGLDVDVNTYTVLDPNLVVKESEPETDADAVPEAEPETDAVPEAEPEAVPEAEPEAVPEAVPEAESVAVPEPVSQLSKTKSKPKSNSVTEPLSQLSPKKKSITPSVTEPLSELSKTKTKPKSVAETDEPLTQLSKTKPSTKPEPMSVTEPEKVKKSTMPKTAEKKSTETPAKEKYVPQAEEPAKGLTYESPLSKANIQSIIARTKSHKSTAKLMKDYQAGIMPSTPEEEKRLRDALVSIVASKMSKKASTASAAAAELSSAVSKLKEDSKAKESVSNATVKANTTVSLKQSRSIPAVRTKSKPDKVV